MLLRKRMNEDKDLIPVDGHHNLFRDRNTGAIVNKDKSSYMHYMRLKEQKQKEKSELDQVKKDIEEIKSLLKEIINGSGQN